MGLMVAIYALTIIASKAGTEFRLRDVLVLATILAAGTSAAELGVSVAAGPVFSRADGLVISMPANVTRMLANRIADGWANRPEIVVVRDMQDAAVPQDVRDSDAQQRSGGEGPLGQGAEAEALAEGRQRHAADEHDQTLQQLAGGRQAPAQPLQPVQRLP